MWILSIDPSGNFTEGKGTTGWAMFKDGKLDDFGEIKAEDQNSVELYWLAVIDLLDRTDPDAVVCESFRLQPGKAPAQSWSHMETPQLIGALRIAAFEYNVKFVLQDPSCKARIPDNVLVKMKIIEKRNGRHYALDRPTNDHIRDAIRHGVYYHFYGRGKE